MFVKMYDFMKKYRDEGITDEKITKKAIIKFGKENLSHIFEVDRLLFMQLY